MFNTNMINVFRPSFEVVKEGRILHNEHHPYTLVPLAPLIFLIDTLELRTRSTSTRSLVIRYIMR